ncbi:MAG: BatD family protein, partial [Campylobacteraceae bacterium]|nr:BatD family protein [Campylobacteraceae bacterium]
MFKFVLLIILFTTSMYSSVVLKSQASFTPNEAFLFSYEVSGSNVKFPNIERIASYEVFSRGSSSKFYYVNGKSSRQIIKQYMIYPKADFVIPSFIFELNGEEVKSEKKLIKKLKISKSKYKNFDLTMTTKKQNIYVGEEVLLKIQFKYKKDLQLIDLSLEKPDFSNFWFKQLDKKNTQYEENNYIVQDIYFIVFAQKEGSLIIPPIKVNLQVLDPYSNSFSFISNAGKNIKIYSNDLKFNVKALPDNISLYGDFKINSSISKSEIKEGEALSYKINIRAYGNIDDLEDIKLDIKNTTIYENKAEIKNLIKDSLYYGSYSKSFSIIADEDFIIPSYILKYFDKNTKTIKTIKTKEYKIKVIKNKKNNINN